MAITRRDFVNGTLVAAGASMLPAGCRRPADPDGPGALHYPPALTGLRGSHPGSNVHAHDRALGMKSEWGTATELNESYDLIVVGGGISGLAAAYLHQRERGRDKRVLILDNHDDFGGHAKRNEHRIGDRTLISYGGSQSIVEPKHASEVVLALLKDVGVDVERFDTAYDRDFFRRNNLGAVTYFNREVFGEDKVVKHPFCNYPNYIEGMVMGGKLSDEEAVRQTPLSERGREQLLRVLHGPAEGIPSLHRIDLPGERGRDDLRSHSYFDYLRETLGVDDPGVLRMARHSALDWALTGTDLMSIGVAKGCGALGFAPKAVYDEENPYIYHFPDGNAGVARALVKKLIPGVAEGRNAEELVLAKFDYAELDRSSNEVRIRLSSTAVNVRHEGDPASSDGVVVDYVHGDKLYQVHAGSVVMACYNMMIPHIISGLPQEQVAALKLQTKSPLQYSSVGLRNWRAMKDMEIGMAMSPGNMHQAVLMDFPVSLGSYEYTRTPDDPCVLQMISCPYGAVGAPQRAQYSEARYRMLSLQFEDYEQEIRSHLTGMLPGRLFDFDRDVESITVNRWGHGYTVGGPGDSTKIGRQPFGRIAIANCDSAPGADMKTAIDMAWRAVSELP
ncbi:MAG: NAD(P)-binding protein [bacterium]|nr:NAD(P)-binding protein [bacterium]